MNKFLMLSALTVLTAAGFPQSADLVLKNGTVYTVDQAMSVHDAVAILGNKILAVGRDSEMDKFIGEETHIIDLGGKTVVPGFIDSHYHFMGMGRRAYVLNFDGAKSLTEFLHRIKDSVRDLPAGSWVRGRGWIEEDWPEKRFPTRHDLDAVAKNHLLFLKRADGHAAVVNSKALEIAGITSDSEDPEGGKILRDETGLPTGMLLEDSAQDLVEDLIPLDTSKTDMQKYARKANEIALAYGLTTIHNMGNPWKNQGWNILNVWKELYKSGQMQVRIVTYPEWPFEDFDRLFAKGPITGLAHDRLSVRGIKISADGALGSRGAALLEAYSDDASSGLIVHEDQKIYPVISKALEHGLQMAIHCIGDRTNRKILDLYAKAFQEAGISNLENGSPRFRIEHAQIVAPEDIPRFAELGVIPSMQPSHAIGDLHFAVRRLGPERMTRGYAWRTFIDNGSFIPAGSDAPVEEGNPMIEFYAAVTRKDTTGFSAEGWHPELRMTREEALKALTIWGAKAAFEEDIKGSIEPGKLADLVVLEKDLMKEPEARLFDIKVLMTMVGGEIVFQIEDRFSLKE